jgi:hypothetical protein
LYLLAWVWVVLLPSVEDDIRDKVPTTRLTVSPTDVPRLSLGQSVLKEIFHFRMLRLMGLLFMVMLILCI